MSLPGINNKGGSKPVPPSSGSNKGKPDPSSNKIGGVAIQAIKGISGAQNSPKGHSWSQIPSTDDEPQLTSPATKAQAAAQGRANPLLSSSLPKGAPQTHSSSDQSLQDIAKSLEEKAEQHQSKAVQAITDKNALNSLANITDSRSKWVLIPLNFFKPNCILRDAIEVMKKNNCSNVDECLAKLDRSYTDETALTDHFRRKADILNDFADKTTEEQEAILGKNGIEEFKTFFNSSWEELKKFAEQDSPQVTQDLIIQLKTLQRFINLINKTPNASEEKILTAMKQLKRDCANNLEKFCNSDYLLGQYETALKSVSEQLNSGDLSGLMAQLTEIKEEIALFQYFLELPSLKEPLAHLFELKTFLSEVKRFNEGMMTDAKQIDSLLKLTSEIHLKFSSLDNTAMEELYTAYAQAFQVLAMQKTTHALPATAPRALLERWMSAILPSGEAEGTSALREAYEISCKNLDTQILAVRQAERKLLKAANIQTPSSFNPEIAYAATWQPSLTQVAPSFRTESSPSIQGISGLQQLQILRAFSQTETEITNKAKEVELANADLIKLQRQADEENAKVGELETFIKKHPGLTTWPGACEVISRMIAFVFKSESWEETANNFAKIANISENEEKINQLNIRISGQKKVVLDLTRQLESANDKKKNLIEGRTKVEEAWKGLFDAQNNLREYQLSIERPEELTILSTLWQPLTAFAQQDRLDTPISHFAQLQEAIETLEKSLRGKKGIFKVDTAPDAKLKESATQALLQEAKILREDCIKKINQNLLPPIPSEVKTLTSLQQIQLNGNNGALKDQLNTATEKLKYLQEISQQLGMTTQLPDQLTILDQQLLFIDLVDAATNNLITGSDLLALQKQIDSRSNNATPENKEILVQIQKIHDRAAEQLKKEEEDALPIINTTLQNTQSALALAKLAVPKQRETTTQLTTGISTILEPLTNKLPRLSDSLSRELQTLVEAQNGIQELQEAQNASRQQDPTTKTNEQKALENMRQGVIDKFNNRKIELLKDPVIQKICLQFKYDPKEISPEQLKTLSLVLDPAPNGFIKQLQSHARSSSTDALITFWRDSVENWSDLTQTAPLDTLYKAVEVLSEQWDSETDVNNQVDLLNKDYNTLSTEKEILELNQQLRQVLQLVDKMKEYASNKGNKTAEAIKSATENRALLKNSLTTLKKNKLLAGLERLELAVLEWSNTPLLSEAKTQEEAFEQSIVEATTQAAQAQFQEAIESVNARMEASLLQALKHASDLNKQQ